ncbi:MAG: sulfite exporter TauE/SafE family protein [Bdellovibrionales bacterium]|nr:sulfite exporter TauE/SafE family protein [Bdellovibrionales bacterium]
MLSLAIVTFITSLISGILGMAGGLILMGYLVWILPVASAAILHGIIQAGSNGSRAYLLKDHILWAPVLRVTFGLLITFAVFSVLSTELDKAWVYVLLGSLPPLAYVLKSQVRLDILRPGHQILCGLSIGFLSFTAGISGPMIDVFFAHSSADRFEQVSTKATISLIGHAFKVVFFATLFGSSIEIPSEYWAMLPLFIALSVLGSFLGKKVLQKIEDQRFRVYAWRMLFGISAFYLAKGMSAFAQLL